MREVAARRGAVGPQAVMSSFILFYFILTWQVQHSSCLSTVLLAQEELLGDFRIYFVQCDEARPAGAQFDNMMTFQRCARLEPSPHL